MLHRPIHIILGALVSAGLLMACSTQTPEDAPQPDLPAASATESAAEAAAEAAEEAGPIFVDVAEEIGLDFVHYNGMSGRLWFVEVVGPGGALFDYDLDGDLDLYVVQGHFLSPEGEVPPEDAQYPTDRLYRNDLSLGADGQPVLRFTDVTESAGVDAGGYGMGVTAGDYDNDGDPDLYLTNFEANELWRNEGDGTFTDVTAEAGVEEDRWSISAAFVDYDQDEDLDLFVVNYDQYTLETHRPCFSESGRADLCGPSSYDYETDRLFRNNGDGSFEDVSGSAGFAGHAGPGLGVTSADFNQDGWLDIYVANDGYENFLWISDEGQRFENVAFKSGAAVNSAGQAEASMGVVAEDFDEDGDEDLFMTHLSGETHALFVNDGTGLFQDRTRMAGIAATETSYTAFGVGGLDYDNDGWLDLVIADGAVFRIEAQADAGDPMPFKMPNQLLRNAGQGRFEEVPPALAGPPFQSMGIGRGLAQGDIDNDGDRDALIFHNNGAIQALRNEVGNRKPWIGLQMVGDVGAAERDLYGTYVTASLSDGRELRRMVRADGSYASSNDPRILIGLGEADGVELITARWPDGLVETWSGLETGRYHRLRRGDGNG